MSLGAVMRRVRTLTFAFFLVEVLSLGAVLSLADAATSVGVVFIPIGASRLLFWTGTFAGMLIIDVTLRAVRTSIGALASAGFGVEVLSYRTVLPLADAATCVRVVLVSV